MSNDLNCPYCDAGLEVCHDDGFGYMEGVKHEMQCGKCDKNFVFETSISFYYEPEKADCLNDENHIWKANNTFPVEYTNMCCTMCDKKRKPTELEMAEIITKKNQLIVIRKYPDANVVKYAALSITIWCPLLECRLSGFFRNEADAWADAVKWIENKGIKKVESQTVS
jgi:hypothetical protein